MINAIVDHAVKRFLAQVLIVAAVFTIALVWFYCDRQDEIKEARGVVYGQVETLDNSNQRR